MWIEQENGGSLIYRLDSKRREEFPAGVDRATLVCGLRTSINEDSKTPWLLNRSLPAKLTTDLSMENGPYRLSVRFYDQERLEQVFEEVRSESWGGRIYDSSDVGRLRSLAESWGFVQFLTCHRRTSGPKESNPNRDIEDSEKTLVLPYVERILLTMGDLELKPPFREPEYYLGLVRALMD